MRFLWWIIVGLIAGWATGKIMKGEGYGTLMDIVIGIVGAVIGGWIMSMLGFARRGVLRLSARSHFCGCMEGEIERAYR
jgi:uncharacterized membrane protein YeaQ/YmgE (transglycosylase-associated protein family)